MATDVRSHADYDDPCHYDPEDPCPVCESEALLDHLARAEFDALVARDPESQPGHQYASEGEEAAWREAYHEYADADLAGRDR